LKLVGEIPANFMLRVLQFVLVDFQRFPKPVGSSTQHERDMERVELQGSGSSSGGNVLLPFGIET